MSVRMEFTKQTEHGTIVQVFDDVHSDAVEVTLYDELGDYPQWAGTAYLSLYPQEARAFANALLNVADSVEQRIPHGNC